MSKILELAREAGFTVGFSSAALPKHEKFYNLARVDLEDELSVLRSDVGFLQSNNRVLAKIAKEGITRHRHRIADLEAENAKLKEHLRWALSNINCEPFEWSDEENADAHEAARAALGKTND